MNNVAVVTKEAIRNVKEHQQAKVSALGHSDPSATKEPHVSFVVLR